MTTSSDFLLKRCSSKTFIYNIVHCLLTICCLYQIGGMIYNTISLSEHVNYTLHINSYTILVLILCHLCLDNVIKHFLCIAFYICFFTFLMGQKLFFEEYDTFLTFTSTTLTASQYATFINILSIAEIFTFASYKYYNSHNHIPYHPKTLKDWKTLLPIIRLLFYLTLPFALYMQLKIVLFKSSFLYTESYLTSVNVPTVIKIGNFLFSSIAIIYLASKPSRREALIICFSLIIIEGIVQLFQGRRALFASTFLFLIWYYIKYNNITKIKTRSIAISLGALIGIILLFLYIGNTRDVAHDRQNSLALSIKKFLTSTGGSDSVLANTIVHETDFPENGIWYLTNPIINNPISIILSGKSGIAQGEEYLDNFNSFSHWISYLTEPSLYLSGHGMGSCYLAETYLAFGSIGVMVICIAIGFILSQFANLTIDSHNVFMNSIYFVLIKYLFTLPRDGLFSWFSAFVYLMIVLIPLSLFLPYKKPRIQTAKL